MLPKLRIDGESMQELTTYFANYLTGSSRNTEYD